MPDEFKAYDLDDDRRIYERSAVKITRGLDSSMVELPLQAVGTEDEEDVDLMVQAFLDKFYPKGIFQISDGTNLKRNRNTYYRDYTAEHVGGGVWDITVQFRSSEQVVNIETVGGTTNVKQSIQTVHRYGKQGFEAPDRKGAINDRGDSVEGVDINVSQLLVTVTRYVGIDDMTPDLVQAIFDLGTHVNDSEFKIRITPEEFGNVSLKFDAGECLFLGATVSQKGFEDFEFVFKFMGSPNQNRDNENEIAVDGIDGTHDWEVDGEESEGISKDGHDFLWVSYSKEETGTGNNKQVVNTPEAVYVERVYERGDFSRLGPFDGSEDG